MDSRAVTRKSLLHWDVLVNVLGGEDGVRDMIERIGEVKEDPALSEALRLANDYLGGWRPSDWE